MAWRRPRPHPAAAARCSRSSRSRSLRVSSAARVPFELPRGEALAVRLGSVLEVVYLIFNEGYTATSGDHWMRPRRSASATSAGRIQSPPDVAV